MLPFNLKDLWGSLDGVSHYVNNVKKVQGDVGVTCHLLTQKTTTLKKLDFFQKYSFTFCFSILCQEQKQEQNYILSECWNLLKDKNLTQWWVARIVSSHWSFRTQAWNSKIFMPSFESLWKLH